TSPIVPLVTICLSSHSVPSGPVTPGDPEGAGEAAAEGDALPAATATGTAEPGEAARAALQSRTTTALATSNETTDRDVRTTRRPSCDHMGPSMGLQVTASVRTIEAASSSSVDAAGEWIAGGR